MTNNAQVKTGLDIAQYLIIGRPLVMLSGRYNINGRGILFSIHHIERIHYGENVLQCLQNNNNKKQIEALFLYLILKFSTV